MPLDDDRGPPWPPRPGDDGRGNLVMWTLYDHPRDFPHCYVARQFIAHPLGGQPTGTFMVHAELDVLRRYFITHGFSCLGRDPNDDPVIVETWL